MSVREIDRFLEQWQMDAKALRRRMILAPTPRERERWHAVWLLAQGWTAAPRRRLWKGTPHTIGRWASAFGEGGPDSLIFEQTGGSPPPLDQAQQEELKEAVEQPPSVAGIEMANWYWKVVGHHLYRQPGAVGGEAARGEMVEPDAVLQVPGWPSRSRHVVDGQPPVPASPRPGR